MTNWNELFRPNTLDEVLGQGHIVDKLKIIRDKVKSDGSDADMPHLFFAGPAGVGKTATAIALMKDMFGKSWKQNFMELNASDEGNIEHIRTKVKERATQGTIGTFQTDVGERRIPFNVIFLDEADHLSSKAQAALRRIMEKYAHITRFIISCNYPHKIIEPLRDRCAFSEVRFHRLTTKAIIQNLIKIIKTKTINIDKEAIHKISELADGSMRKAQNILYDANLSDKKITLNDLKGIGGFGMVEGERLLKNIKNKDYADIDKYIDTLYYYKGISVEEIIETLVKAVFEKKDDKMIATLGEYLMRISLSDNKILQLKCMLRLL